MTINIKDMDRIAAKLKDAKGSDNYENVLQKYTGPGTGIVWDEETDTLNIASDWYADANGDIIRR